MVYYMFALELWWKGNTEVEGMKLYFVAFLVFNFIISINISNTFQHCLSIGNNKTVLQYKAYWNNYFIHLASVPPIQYHNLSDICGGWGTLGIIADDFCWRYLLMLFADDICWWYLLMIFADDIFWWYLLMIFVEDICWWYFLMIFADNICLWYLLKIFVEDTC